MPLRLLPLGASITFGSGSTDGNGFRKHLRDMLIADGHAVRMVGSLQAGTMQNNDNEGWRGYRIDQIEEKGRESAAKYLPNIITIQAGTNDCISGYDIDHVGERLRRMLELLWRICPGSTLVLSTLPVNSSSPYVEPRVRRANDQIRYLWKHYADQGRRIVLADMHGLDGPQLSDLVDGTHPNDEGYLKMARIWHRAILEAEARGFLRQNQWDEEAESEGKGGLPSILSALTSFIGHCR